MTKITYSRDLLIKIVFIPVVIWQKVRFSYNLLTKIMFFSRSFDGNCFLAILWQKLFFSCFLSINRIFLWSFDQNHVYSCDHLMIITFFSRSLNGNHVFLWSFDGNWFTPTIIWRKLCFSCNLLMIIAFFPQSVLPLFYITFSFRFSEFLICFSTKCNDLINPEGSTKNPRNPGYTWTTINPA